ncbi:MAG: TetR/AcrR family transcriptional regulator [Candidatus Nanopelagicales bacterium]|jgi:AcrR family transcriptional regulator|nr:TetR/AcrR family transcriptional regulator [Candidatus Nanopelagicales bacterium]MCU0296635.1 TetR/AcrR family transcriptional regulator [Candidatus Nanopelagicales bacterium]
MTSEAPPSPRTQAQRSSQTRRTILDRAAEAFAQDGFAGTSLNDVIAGSGLTKGAFYFHFPSKEALAVAVVDDLREQWTAAVSTAVDPRTPAPVQAQNLAAQVVDAYSRNRSLRAIGRLVPDLAAARPDLAPQLQASLFLWIDLIESVVDRGQQEGSIRSDLGSREIAETVFAAFSGVEEQSELMSQGADVSVRISTLMALLSTGMTTTKPA